MIDVSGYQGAVDWHRVRASGVERAYVKATEGTSFVDGTFHANVEGARSAGVTVGAYHFAHPANSPAADLSHFLRTISGHVFPGDLPPCLDLEVTDGHDWTYLNEWKGHFLGGVDEAIGLYAGGVLYTYYSFWHNLTLYPERPVWGAAYNNAFTPPPTWVAWQYSSVGTCPGVTGHVDVSRVLHDFPAVSKPV